MNVPFAKGRFHTKGRFYFNFSDPTIYFQGRRRFLKSGTAIERHRRSARAEGSSGGRAREGVTFYCILMQFSKTLNVNGSSACLISCRLLIININWVIMKLSFTYFFHCEIHTCISFCFFSDNKVRPNIFQIKEDFDAPLLQKIIL